MGKLSMKFRQLKSQLLECLTDDNWRDPMKTFLNLPPAQLINPLISLLYHANPVIKWRAVTMIGLSFANFSPNDRESARIIIRRFMWYLNEESGGIGWGIPEAFGEVMARYKWIAEEYASILVHYIVPGISFIDIEAIQTGVIWGIGRGAQGNRELFQFSETYLHPFLSANTPEQRGNALWALQQLQCKPPSHFEAILQLDTALFSLYDHCVLKQMPIAELASQ